MSAHILTRVAVWSAAFALAACSTSIAGRDDGASGASTGRQSGAASTTGSSAPSSASTAAGLASVIKRGVQGVRSAHIEFSVHVAGQAVSASGDERLDNGALEAMHLIETLPAGAGTLELVIVGAKTYAKLPPELGHTTKPWVLISANSSNPAAKLFASALAQARSSASIGSFGAFARAAQQVRNLGPVTVDGMRTTRYSLTVDLSKLPLGALGSEAAKKAGVSSVPVQLYIDGSGRPVKITENFSVSGQTVSSTIGISGYNRPVTIQAPPASQVGN